ncbi:hypothetical protein [Okeania sp. SIO2C2]|uniref:hypothetical protein n=1 Tax=Okeania sp. SIO2C2 TaxID=2607787 RepID=UPI00257DB1A8|nr:hypothetical protein [Okeania sp. SIO2C2]
MKNIIINSKPDKVRHIPITSMQKYLVKEYYLIPGYEKFRENHKNVIAQLETILEEKVENFDSSISTIKNYLYFK